MFKLLNIWMQILRCCGVVWFNSSMLVVVHIDTAHTVQTVDIDLKRGYLYVTNLKRMIVDEIYQIIILVLTSMRLL
jgi:hypothetical protein